MTIIKSFSVGNGDMFYIEHYNDTFSIIDCCLSDETLEIIVDEIVKASKYKKISRFISTHPDDDHIRGLKHLDDKLKIRNFYCVNNKATKNDETEDFTRYCDLRDDPKKAFYIQKGFKRKWINQGNEERGSSGIDILWPDIENIYFKEELKTIKQAKSPNNISPVIKYSLRNSLTAIWMGDMKNDFIEKVKDGLNLPDADILFAPHHGRKSGKIPKKLLEDVNPKIIIIGEAPSEHLDYYEKYKTITQNSSGDIIFECIRGKVHIYVSNKDYEVDFLDNEGADSFDYYLGTLNVG